jgi:hypothetical protein
MTGRLNKLKQDLKNIETEVVNLAEKMREKYQIYLDLLGDSLYKQAIGAVYHICTRCYPGEFLALSHSNRQKLQEDIKTLGQEAKVSLHQLGEVGFDRGTFPGLEALKNPSEAINAPNFLKPFLDKPESLESTPSINNPDILLHCSRVLEKSCLDILNYLSKQINHQLQQAYILPSHLPSQILDMAIQAGDEGQSLGGGHNLLNILVEAKNPEQEEEDKDDEDEDDEDDEDEDEDEDDFLSAKVTKITAIHLRIPEIEFADTRLSMERNQIRSLWEQLNRLGEQYHRTRKEYTIAQAESAWRSSWYD